MKNLKLLFVSFIIYFTPPGLEAQEDYHLSQIEATSLYLNPATTGMFFGEKGDYRIVSDYRSQWSTLGIKPFSTTFLSFDMPIKKTKHYRQMNNKWGVGGYLINNKSGAGQFSTINILASAAYNVITHSHKHYLTIGLQAGLLYKSFNPADYTYDIQYSPATGNFDPNIDNQENFERTNLYKLDANVGVFYKYANMNKKFRPYGGCSFYHVTKPNDAFSDYNSRLSIRFVLHTGSDIIIHKQLSVRPRFIYMTQAKGYDATIGGILMYKINNSTHSLLGGIDYRLKDAVVVHIGFIQGGHSFRFSYDINTSSLTSFTGGRGAWEFSVVLVGRRSQPILKSLF